MINMVPVVYVVRRTNPVGKHEYLALTYAWTTDRRRAWEMPSSRHADLMAAKHGHGDAVVEISQPFNHAQ